jgi:CheY-like chemotaxis protein
MRVLFVDDDAAVAQSVKTVLRSKGHSCKTTDLGEQAIALAKQNNYDVIVLDVGLPDIDGYHVFRRMKMESVETPVLMQSGLTEQDLAAEAADLGIQDVLVKPFSVNELIERIETMMARSRPQDQEPETRPEPVAQTKPPAQAKPKPEPLPHSKPGSEPGATAGPAPSPRQERPAGSEAVNPAPPPNAAAAAAPAPAAEPAAKSGPPPAAASAVTPAPSRSPGPTPGPTPGPAPGPTPGPPPSPVGKPAGKPPANPVPDVPPPSKAQPAQAAARHNSQDKSGAERRRHERIPTVQAALITEQGRHMACVILNISEGGAALKLSDPSQDCPKSFNLQQLDGPERRCEIRWRNGAQMGVMFI